MTLPLSPLPAHVHSEGDRRTDTCHLNWASPVVPRRPMRPGLDFVPGTQDSCTLGHRYHLLNCLPGPRPSATLRISKGMNKRQPDLRLLKQQESNLTSTGVLSELFGGLNLNLAHPSTPTLWHSIICIYITGFMDTFCSAQLVESCLV